MALRPYNRDLNVQFFFDKIVKDNYKKIDFKKISQNFFIKGEKIKLFKTPNTTISKSFTYLRDEELYYINETGYIYSDEYQIQILPMLYLDSNKIFCYAIIPVKALDPNLTIELIIEEISKKGFKVGNFNLQEVAYEILEKYEEGEGEKVFVCQGTMPVPAIPDSLVPIESEYSKEILELHAKLGNDFLFYEELNFLSEVQKGEIVGNYIPARKGKKGIDVFGKPVDFTITQEMKIGENLELLPQKDVVAKTDGHLKIGIDGVFSVNKTHVVSGNLESDLFFEDETDIFIKKNIPPGKIVKTKGAVRVLGNVEGSLVECEGEIIVAGGIVSKSKVTSKKGIEVQFISFSEVTVAENVKVRKYIIDSHVTCGGYVLVKFHGTGHITGGRIVLKKNLITNILGAASGKETIVEIVQSIGKYEELYNKIMLKLETNKTILTKLSTTLGPIFMTDPENFIKKLTPDQQKKILPVVQQLKKIIEENKRINEKKDEIETLKKEEKKKNKVDSNVIVLMETFDNVVIRIHDSETRTKEVNNASSIYQVEYQAIVRKPYQIDDE